MDNVQIEKEINTLKDSKIDKVLLEDVNTDALSNTDVSGETAAVKETIRVLTDLISKLKTK